MSRHLVLAGVLAGFAMPALATGQLPDSVRQMVEAAANSGDKAKIDAVVGIAKQTNAGAAAEIDAIVAAIASKQAAEKEKALRAANFFDNWKGRGQLGGAISTGNSKTKSLTAGLALERSGLQWRHRADAQLDLVDSDGGTDQERVLAGYQLDYKFSERAYVWGRLEYERNREAGIKRRFAESAGLGWRVLVPGPVSWDLEVGPALRQTRYIDYSENSVAVRGASRFLWNVSPVTALSNDTAIFWDESGTVTNSLALTSKLFGALSSRVSFNLAWEEHPPEELKRLDTTTRVTLVYDF